jgi:hypothetical protein
MYVAYGGKQVRVFESTDLKDNDSCELVLLKQGDDINDNKGDESDVDDKNIPMSESPESLPKSRARNSVPATAALATPAPQVSSTRSSSIKILPEGNVSTRSNAGSKRLDEQPPAKKRRKVMSNTKKQNSGGALKVISKKKKKSLDPETRILVERYDDGHFYEVIVKRYLSESRRQKVDQDSCWAFVHFVEKDQPERKWTKNWVDLNSLRSLFLDEDQVVHLHEWEPGHKGDEEVSFLGRRLAVKWKDGNNYAGTVTRTIATDSNFVFIEYDDGDQCWSDLTEEADVFELLPDNEGDKISAGDSRPKGEGRLQK